MRSEPVLSVSDFVAVLNQSLEIAYPQVGVVGELANFRLSKNRWVYFDLKDETASLRCFGSVYQLPGPLEDGMTVRVTGVPRLHPLYSFSFNFRTIRPVGEGTLKKTASLLQSKLEAEGLFDAARKRPLPYLPERIGLITSIESAAYADFVKVSGQRWSGLDIHVADVQVQGDVAIEQICCAITGFNNQAELADTLVIIRGGGSADDLAAYNSEQVTRAVASSRIPTLVAIGHETDVSLAELAADQRASTPSNAAEILLPDKVHELAHLLTTEKQLYHSMTSFLDALNMDFTAQFANLERAATTYMRDKEEELSAKSQLLEALSPSRILKRGYAVLRDGRQTFRSAAQLSPKQQIEILMHDGQADVSIKRVTIK